MKRVLVVDDEQQMLVALDATLSHGGYTVTTASNGLEAVGKLRDNFFQAVISDVRMPELTGLDLLQQVKRLSPLTPVILLTGHGSVGDAVSALKNGAFDYLMKPFSPDQLSEVLGKATSGCLEEPNAEQPILTQNAGMRKLLATAARAAQSDATILIEAESGTGKELLARFIHSRSGRSAGAFVAVNCAAMPAELLESEMFGHERGAFTGAEKKKPGRFEMADRGTILLDEVGEMAPLLQAKLLRVLQEGEIDRVGGLHPIPVDVRVVATTNRNLLEQVRAAAFREDLYYRLNVIPLSIPPLRDRKEDIPLLISHFCEKYGSNRVLSFAEETLRLLSRYDWPGNVRELENVTRRALALCRNPVVAPADLILPSEDGSGNSVRLEAGVSLRELERQIIRITLQETCGNRTHAARMLGISLRTLRNKLAAYRKEGEIL